ncbi:TPA: hypothetical protein ACTW0Y_004436 [Raoultella planticola]
MATYNSYSIKQDIELYQEELQEKHPRLSEKRLDAILDVKGAIAERFKDIDDKEEAVKEHVVVCNIIRANKELSRDDFSKFMDFAQMYWRQYQSECAQEA